MPIPTVSMAEGNWISRFAVYVPTSVFFVLQWNQKPIQLGLPVVRFNLHWPLFNAQHRCPRFCGWAFLTTAPKAKRLYSAVGAKLFLL